MNRKELIEYCLKYPGILEDYPFEDTNSTIMRHSNNRKWFSLIFEMEHELCINLKCEPIKADFWRSVFKDVTPAWHMNKTHWNTVKVNGDVPEEELFAMIDESFELTQSKVKAKKRIIL